MQRVRTPISSLTRYEGLGRYRPAGAPGAGAAGAHGLGSGETLGAPEAGAAAVAAGIGAPPAPSNSDMKGFAADAAGAALSLVAAFIKGSCKFGGK